jgi:hypothetical protein
VSWYQQHLGAPILLRSEWHNLLHFDDISCHLAITGPLRRSGGPNHADSGTNCNLCISLSLSLTATAQQKPSPLSPYVKDDAPVLVLEHARLIDGTGSAPKEDMRIDIAGGKITAVQAANAHSPYPANAKVCAVIPKQTRFMSVKTGLAQLIKSAIGN